VLHEKVDAAVSAEVSPEAWRRIQFLTEPYLHCILKVSDDDYADWLLPGAARLVARAELEF
jgi:hypothetical protein